jgi:hypothetical protein
MASETPQILAIHHLVHEYANFVSSAEMTIHGKDTDGEFFKPPLNTHVSHAFYLNCRKLSDFFQNKRLGNDDVVAMHFVVGYWASLPICEEWRNHINKQLTHVTYFRDVGSREIDKAAQVALYCELRETWREFRRQLPDLYAAEFVKKLKERKEPYATGALSEFRHYNLD